MNTSRVFLWKSDPAIAIAAFCSGLVLAVGGSVLATTIGTNLSVDGSLTTNSTTASSSVTYALGVATTTPGTTFSVSGNAYVTGGIGAGIATTTAGALQTTGPGQIGGALSVTGASSFTGASTHVGTVAVGASGTALTQLLTGYVSCGPLNATNAIAATSSGVLVCTGLSNVAGADAVFLTATSSITSFNDPGRPVIYWASSAVRSAFSSFRTVGDFGSPKSDSPNRPAQAMCHTENGGAALY